MTSAALFPTTGTRSAEIGFEGKRFAIEYDWLCPTNAGPLIVFLHEGLGSLRMWRDFPRSVCELSGCRGLVYSRSGYGKSTPFWPNRQWPIEFMHLEAEELLPRFLRALDVDAAGEPIILFGHSDGASIALIYASRYAQCVQKLIALAPHVFVETVTIESIAKAHTAFSETDLPKRLGKYHDDVDYVFSGWAATWLHPLFLAWNIEMLLDRITCPILAVQGTKDHYGTMDQIDSIERLATNVRLLKLTDCGHSPHVDQPALLLTAVTDFLTAT